MVRKTQDLRHSDICNNIAIYNGGHRWLSKTQQSVGGPLRMPLLFNSVYYCYHLPNRLNERASGHHML